MEQALAEQEGPTGAAGTDASKSELDPYMQGVAHRNSAFSQLKFSEYLLILLSPRESTSISD